MITVIKIVFLLGFLVFIHEFGHYTIAKMCKIKVNEFSLGFGPKLFEKTNGETKYQLRAIPLGGFVRLEGEEEQSDEEGSFNKASIPKRIAVLLAGGLVNIIFGIIAFTVLVTVRYMIVKNVNMFEALEFGFESCGELIIELAKGIASIFTGQISLSDMTGPVGISSMVSKTSGIVEFIYLLSIISISLGVTNLLPFVPLDGGKVVLLIIESIRKKPLKQEIELKIQTVGFVLLIMFSVVVTFHDIMRL